MNKRHDKQEPHPYDNLSKGTPITISGNGIYHIRCVQNVETTQLKAPDSDPDGEKVQVDVVEWYFAVYGRGFVIKDDGYSGSLLTNTIKKRNKKNDPENVIE